MRWNTFPLLKTLIITMKCLVKLTLLIKAKMQVYSYLLVVTTAMCLLQTYSCMCEISHVSTVYMGIYKKNQPSGPAML